SGGYICGSRSLIDLLINRARSFIFSTAANPAASAAAAAGIRVAQSPAGDERRCQLWDRVGQVRKGLPAISINLGWGLLPRSDAGPPDGSVTSGSHEQPVPGSASAILPLIVGEESKAMELAARLRERHFLVPAIRYPTVGRGQARLRLTMTAEH